MTALISDSVLFSKQPRAFPAVLSPPRRKHQPSKTQCFRCPGKGGGCCRKGPCQRWLSFSKKMTDILEDRCTKGVSEVCVVRVRRMCSQTSLGSPPIRINYGGNNLVFSCSGSKIILKAVQSVSCTSFEWNIYRKK